MLNSNEFIASFFFSYKVDSQLPNKGEFSNMMLKSPVKIVLTLQAGFQVSGWKSEIDKQSLLLGLNRPLGVYM